MQKCDHTGTQVYVRRTNPDGSIQYAIQCLQCLQLVKLPKHSGKLFIKHSEIPSGETIYTEVTP